MKTNGVDTKSFRGVMGMIVRKHRLAAGLSYRELERKCGLDSSTVHDLENARCDLTVYRLHRLSHILGPAILAETYGYVARKVPGPKLVEVKKRAPTKKQIADFMRKIG